MNLAELRRKFENIITTYSESEHVPASDLKRECQILAERFQSKNATGHSLAWLLNKCWDISESLIGLPVSSLGHVGQKNLCYWNLLSLDEDNRYIRTSLNEIITDLDHAAKWAEQGQWTHLEILVFVHSSKTAIELVTPVQNRDIADVFVKLDKLRSTCHADTRL